MSPECRVLVLLNFKHSNTAQQVDPGLFSGDSTRPWRVAQANALTGEGLGPALEWLLSLHQEVAPQSIENTAAASEEAAILELLQQPAFQEPIRRFLISNVERFEFESEHAALHLEYSGLVEHVLEQMLQGSIPEAVERAYLKLTTGCELCEVGVQLKAMEEIASFRKMVLKAQLMSSSAGEAEGAVDEGAEIEDEPVARPTAGLAGKPKGDDCMSSVCLKRLREVTKERDELRDELDRIVKGRGAAAPVEPLGQTPLLPTSPKGRRMLWHKYFHS
eukprot:TRINITY_DN44271_c0_g1_i1.p1 TRINITY_DN44271_c0_g1~~TRINITY_DN44271_c0_g1_i1.p1  ORF type:complete len:276 (+),score=60.44 TRINITY_DN44271_c0_g1_i1:259-1086(+)